MTDVYLLWHIHDTGHGDEETKLIGVYSTEQRAQQAIARLKQQPGFKDYPDDFQIELCGVDETGWQEGFITVAESLRAIKDEA